MLLTALLGLSLSGLLSAGQQPRKPQQLSSPDQVPEGLAKSDWTSIREAYEAGQHAFQPIEGGWQARNPGQQWTTTFDRRGFMARPREGDWQWGLALQSYGFGKQQRGISGTPAVGVQGQRLTYQWDPDLQEWWLNDKRGLEHGFTLRERPAVNPAENPSAALRLMLAVRGSLTARITPDALGVDFLDDAGATVLTYAGLKVWDADGKILPSHFEPVDAAPPSQVTLSVDERGARYPLTIDPIAQQAYLKSGNNGGPSDDLFGYAVAVSGDTVVVGTPAEDSSTTGINSTPNDDATEAGAAFVFVRSGTAWTQQAYLKPSNAGVNDIFGTAVAVSGDTVVVGAFGEDSSTTGINSTSDELASGSGAAYVFVRSGTAWTQQAYLKPSNTGVDDFFGTAVAVSGDTVVVGASGEDSSTTGINSTPDEGASGSGAAYVFVRSGTAWTQQAYLKPSNTGANDFFGTAVAVSGDTVVVGANREDSSTTGINSTPNEGASNSGAAYVFVRSGTAWTQQAYLKASNTGVSDNFGTAVAVSGDTLVVGAFGEDSSTTGINSTFNNSAAAAGAAYVFVRSTTESVTTWAQQAYLKAGNTEANDYFGIAVAVSGDTVVVGAYREDSSTTGINSTFNNSASDSGAAYVFVRSGTTWTQQAYLKASNTGVNYIFGTAVAISGDTVVVGASGEGSSTTGINSTPNEAATEAGAAYVFVRSGTAWTQQAYLKPSNTGVDDFFGYAVAVSGDTVVVGAFGEGSSTTGINSTPDEGASASGAAYLFTGLGLTMEMWTQTYFGNATMNVGNEEDFDSDGVVNLQEFAFGTLPNNNASGSGTLQYTGTFAGGGTLTSNGQPGTGFEPISMGIDFRALFVRRKDYAAAELTFTPQFSADLSTWQDSAAVPTVLADDGTYQLVSVPYPPFIGGKKARFFRINITKAL